MENVEAEQVLDLPVLWKNSDGKRFTEKFVFDWVRETTLDIENEYQVVVGTDSHMHGIQFKFISVVCVYRVGKGGNYYYLESFEPRERYVQGPRGKKVKGNQKMRMFNEVEKSISLADSLFEETGVLPMVHIDASPSDRQEFTSAFSDQLQGYVIAAGYECRIKPKSWAANCIADRHSK